MISLSAPLPSGQFGDFAKVRGAEVALGYRLPAAKALELVVDCCSRATESPRTRISHSVVVACSPRMSAVSCTLVTRYATEMGISNRERTYCKSIYHLTSTLNAARAGSSVAKWRAFNKRLCCKHSVEGIFMDARQPAGEATMLDRDR